MKFERLNENQIRCTLTKNDLLDRQIKISELAYGSEKAKSLFRDMMKQASKECGFEADDIPLMIEAVPVSAECVVLTITKVDDPEELDTRFSKFSPSVASDIEEMLSDRMSDDITDLFTKIQGADSEPEYTTSYTERLHGCHQTTKESEKPQQYALRIYRFDTLDTVIRLAHVVSELPLGRNSLYKDTTNNCYELMIDGNSMAPECYNKLCNITSEYGRDTRQNLVTEDYYAEHLDPLCLNHALQSLAIV